MIKTFRFLANPIMLKTLYQGVHSKAFVVAFWILLVTAIMAYCISFAESSLGDMGSDMFFVFCLLINIMTVTVIPFMAFNILHNEVITKTLELVQITGISPGCLVRGAFWAALTKVAFVYAVIAPFAMASFLFGGVGITQILMTFGLILILSLSCVAMAIFFGSLAAYKGIKIFARWGYYAFALFMLCFSCGGSYEVFREMMRTNLKDAELLLICGGSLISGILVILILLTGAANALTFPHNRSSARTKFISLWVLMVVFAWILIGVLLGEIRRLDEAIGMHMIICSAIITVGSLYWMGAEPHMTHTQVNKHQKRGPGKRFLFFPFLDGVAPSFLYMLGCLCFCCLGALVFYLLMEFRIAPRLRMSSGNDLLYFTVYPFVMTIVFTLFITAQANLLLRITPKRFRNPGIRRGLMAFVLVLGFPILFFCVINNIYFDDINSFVAAFFPIAYLFVMAEQGIRFFEFLLNMAGPFLIGFLFLCGRTVNEALYFREKTRWRRKFLKKKS